MKKLVLAALAIAAMAACTKSNVQYEQPGEITLQPVAQKATKAAVDGTAYPTTEAYNFNVWAWWGDETAGTELAYFDNTITPYIEKGEFVLKSGTSWSGSTPYYWPTKGSLVFAGYSPASASGTFEYDFENKTFKATNYIQSNDISKTNDLMWFDVTGSSYNNNGTTGVPVVFKHALSWLTFKFNLKDSNTTPNWTVTNVKLTGIETMANCEIVKGYNPEWTNRTVPNDADLTDVEREAAKTMQIYSGSEQIGYFAGATWTNGSTTVTDFGGKALESTSNGVLVIPQSCAPGTPADGVNAEVPPSAELVITYNQETYVVGQVLTGQEVRLPLNGTGINNSMWEPGKHYIYTITFGAEEILIAPTVAEWDDVPVANIPVQ